MWFSTSGHDLCARAIEAGLTTLIATCSNAAIVTSGGMYSGMTDCTTCADARDAMGSGPRVSDSEVLAGGPGLLPHGLVPVKKSLTA